MHATHGIHTLQLLLFLGYFFFFVVFYSFVIFLHFFKLRNDINLLFVACHNNRSLLTTKKIGEHGISAKKKNNKNNKVKNQVLIYYCENLNVYSIPTSARERTATM